MYGWSEIPVIFVRDWRDYGLSVALFNLRVLVMCRLNQRVFEEYVGYDTESGRYEMYRTRGSSDDDAG